jgi:hypothetical protein
MVYGLDPINDRSVDMIAAAHERGWEPVEADAEDVNSYANPVELPATRLGVEGGNGCEGTTETRESVARPGEATRGKHMREAMLVV